MEWFVITAFLTLIVSGTCIPNWNPRFDNYVNRLNRAASCKISIQTDLSKASPLLLRPWNQTQNTNDAYYLPTNRNGEITFTSSNIIHLTCPDGTVFLNGRNTGESIVPVQCSGSGKNFDVIKTKERATLSQFKCSKPGQTARYTNKSCLGKFKEIEVGFKVAQGQFLREITVCFDPIEQNTAYSVYNLTKFIGGSQSGTSRPQFEALDFYNTGKHEVYNLYSNYVQRLNVNRQLGLSSNSKKYIGDGDYYLSRGHLTAKADFVYGSQQNATFFYVNAAPQWQIFNEGNWNELEKSVRQLARDRNLDLEVYTGTHGVITLPHDSTGRQTPVYLYSENGKHGIPVPRMYWKVVYDRRTKAGVAFVGLNNPYNNVISNEILCNDICSQIKWPISWDKTNIKLGYSYCCDVNQLRQNVKNIPNFFVKSVLV